MLREAIRLTREGLPPGIDLVLTSRRGGIPLWQDLLLLIPKLTEQVRGRLEARNRPKAPPGSDRR